MLLICSCSIRSRAFQLLAANNLTPYYKTTCTSTYINDIFWTNNKLNRPICSYMEKAIFLRTWNVSGILQTICTENTWTTLNLHLNQKQRARAYADSNKSLESQRVQLNIQTFCLLVFFSVLWNARAIERMGIQMVIWHKRSYCAEKRERERVRYARHCNIHSLVL